MLCHLRFSYLRNFRGTSRQSTHIASSDPEKNISIVYIFVIRQPLLQQLSYIPNILQDFLKISFGWYTQLLSWVRYPKESIGFFRSECNGTNRVQCPSSRNTNGTRLAVLLTCLDATSLLWLEKNLVMGRAGRVPKIEV